MSIQLWDTFNDVQISSHRTLIAAVKRQRQHLSAVKRSNGQNAFLTYSFRYSDGSAVDGDEITQTKQDLDQKEWI